MISVMPHPAAPPAFTSTIRAEAARRRLTAADLAAVAGIGRGAMSARLNGRTRWNYAELKAVAERLDLDVAALLADVDTEVDTEVAVA